MYEANPYQASCTDLHRHENHVLACRLLAGSGLLADTHFYNLPNFKQKKNPKKPLGFFGKGKSDTRTHIHRHFLVQAWAQPDTVFFFFL